MYGSQGKKESTRGGGLENILRLCNYQRGESSNLFSFVPLFGLRHKLSSCANYGHAAYVCGVSGMIHDT